MAQYGFEGGWVLDGTGDEAQDSGGRNIKVDRVVIHKTNAGNVVLRDGVSADLLVTEVLADGSRTEYDMGGMIVSKIKYHGTSASTALVYVYGKPVGS